MPDWILVKDRLPDIGQDVILVFHDTFHTDATWPKVAVRPAWRCNVGAYSPNGEWAIEHGYHMTIPIEDGIAWMELPEYVEGRNNEDIGVGNR